MFDRDHWQEILQALAKNKGRTLLTAFGVFWGIFMLILMLGSGAGLRNGVERDYTGGATNSFFAWSNRTTKPYRGLPAGRSFDLVSSDAVAIRQQVAEAKIIAPRSQLGGYRGGNNVTRGTRAGAFSVMGDVPEIRVIEAVHVERGRFLNQPDLDEARKVAVIGGRVRDLLLGADEPVGGNIEINGVYFKVVGVHRPFKDDDGQAAERIYIPLTTFQRAFNSGTGIGWFAITSVDGVKASVVESKVVALLKQRHTVAPDDPRGIGSYNTEKEFEQIQGLFTGIGVLVWVVGLGTLAAGVIGVSNIMLVIVKERTREIGVRRALGATPWSITSQILLESVMLTSVAGYLGLLAGMGLLGLVRYLMASQGADAGMFLNPDVSAASAVQALVLLVVAGGFAGLLPAQRAVSISTVEALRAE